MKYYNVLYTYNLKFHFLLIQNYNISTQIMVNETSMLILITFLIKLLLHYLVIVILYSRYYNKLIFS